MFVTRYRPRRPIHDMRRNFDLFNAMLNSMDTSYQDEDSSYDFTPSVNTREGEHAYHIEVDLPGVKKEDIKVDIGNDQIIISGEKKLKEELKEEHYYKVESYYGTFKRSFTLPENIDTENIHAESENGVLEVIIPKMDKPEVETTKRITAK